MAVIKPAINQDKAYWIEYAEKLEMLGKNMALGDDILAERGTMLIDITEYHALKNYRDLAHSQVNHIAFLQKQLSQAEELLELERAFRRKIGEALLEARGLNGD